MAVPVAQAVRKAYPEANLIWSVDRRCAAVINTNCLVSNLHLADRVGWKLGRWSPKVWKDQIRFYSSLRQHRIEYGIDLQGHSKTALCLRLAKPATRLQIEATDSFAKSLNPIYEPQSLHTVERNLEGLAKLTGIKGAAEWTMPNLNQEFESVARKLDSTKPIASFSVSAGAIEKSYPAHLWREVVAGLIEKGFQVVALGGPTDPAFLQEGVLNLVGQCNLRETMSIVSRSQIHLAADTGSGHIAAAYQVPCVSIFGPMAPGRYRPYGEKVRVLHKGTDPGLVSPFEVLAAVDELRGEHAVSH